MAFEKLAELIFPNVDKTTQYYIEKYPKRNLKEGAVVCRSNRFSTYWRSICSFNKRKISKSN